MAVFHTSINRLLFVGVAWLVLAARTGAVEPVVYRVQSPKIQQLAAELRTRYLHLPDFTLSVTPDDGADVYRLAVLAPTDVQREILQRLPEQATLLPKASGRSSIVIAGPTRPRPAPPPDGVNMQAGFVTPKIAQDGAAQETRDSFSPTHVPPARIEQTLCSLLGARLNEMAPGRFLLTVRRDRSERHCTIEVDRPNARLLIVGDKALCTQLVTLIDAIDRPETPEGRERRFLAYSHVKPETIAKIFEISRSAAQSAGGDARLPSVSPSMPPMPSTPGGLYPESPFKPVPGVRPRIEFRQSDTPDPADRQGMLHEPRRLSSPGGARHLAPHRNPVVQLVGYQFQSDGLDLGGGVDALGPEGAQAGTTTPGTPGPGLEVVTDFRYQILDDLDVVIIDATGAEVARFADMIKEIEKLSKIAEPKIELYPLKHVNCVSLNWVVFQIYADIFRTKQGTVKLIPMIHPNAMLLVGWGHAFDAMKELLETLDQPIATSDNILQVFRLKHASAQYALSILRGTFPIPPLQNSAFAPRVQMFADTRTNALIVQAGPNDMKEIEKLLEQLDVPGAGPKLQVKSFKLKHTMSADLAQVLTSAITPGLSGTTDRKLPALELLVVDEAGERMINSGIMADVRISQDGRTNTVIVTAPAECMPLLEELIKMLDVPAATAEIKVFQILYGDANSMIRTLQSLIPTQLEGQAGPQLPGSQDEDALVPVRFAVDVRTNSILAAGAPNDLKIVEALLYSLDREDRQTRKQTVYMLKSMQAIDVSVAINEYIRSKRSIQQAAPGVVSPYQQIESEVIVIPEHVSNSLIVSATPRFYDEILELIAEIDKAPPQVVIQVLIGEVTLSDTDEFGAEFGIQDSLLFNRSTFESITESTRKITRTENGVTTVIEEPVILNGTANPGWLFNENPSSSLSTGYNDSSAASAGNVGSQLLSNFATGRVSTEAGFGGMVFSANSDAVSIMIRALKETSRLEILSRPQITAMNNQKAMIHVGQLVPRFQGTQNTSYSSSSNVKDEMVGLMLVVTPSISPEGNVVMLVAAEKSKIGTDSVVVGYTDGREVRSPAIDRIHTMTMISAADNETVVMGGLISKENQELTRKVPLLGDIPIIGKLFSYEFNRCRRSELIIIMTPRIVRDGAEMEHIKRVETARMSWCLGGVSRLHGDIGAYDVVSERPYTGDATVVFPDAVDMDALQPLDEAEGPRLAPQIPTPVLPRKNSE